MDEEETYTVYEIVKMQRLLAEMYYHTTSKSRLNHYEMLNWQADTKQLLDELPDVGYEEPLWP